MAIYHLDAAVGSKAGGQSAAAKFDYVCREGKYAVSEQRLIRREGEGELVHAESGNMPAWAKETPALYWQAADEHERANGRLFQQVEIALPRELSQAKQIALAVEFAKALADTPEGSLPYTVAIHRGKGTNPHAHIVLSERAYDGHDRTAETWFKRVASAPRQKGESDEHYQERQSKIDFAKGGARKSIAFQAYDWFDQVRAQWSERANLALAELGREERIDHRSHADRELKELPTIHVGPRVRAVGKDDRQATNEEIRLANTQLAKLTEIEIGTEADLPKIRTEAAFARKQLTVQLAQALREMVTGLKSRFARVLGLRQQYEQQQEAEASAKKAEAELLKPATRTNEWLHKIGDACKPNTRKITLPREAVAICGDAIFGVKTSGCLYGEGSGKVYVMNLENGTRYQATGILRNDLGTLAQVEARRTANGFEYEILIREGKGSEFAAKLRQAANDQLKWDSAVLRRRQKAKDHPKLDRSKSHSRVKGQER